MNGYWLKCSLFLLLALTSVYDKANSDNSMQATGEKGKNLKYLALGDSYTIGESVPEMKRWPIQLVSALESEGFSFEKVQIIAKTGWTTDELMQGIASENPDEDYDLVSLLIGVNNQYRGRSVDEFKVQFTSLLDLAIDFAGGNKDHVFVVSIPDWGVTPFAADRDGEKIAVEIDLYNSAKKDICQRYGILYIPITDISREVKSDSDLVAGDGLHPSGKMYGRWVDERIAQKIVQIFEQ
jgi:lysophospholipase L1-like esterase